MNTNQIPLFVQTAQNMERSLQSAITRIENHSRARQAFIKFGPKCTKKSISYSNYDIQRRANELGLKVLSLTNNSVTLVAQTISGYYKAAGF